MTRQRNVLILGCGWGGTALLSAGALAALSLEHRAVAGIFVLVGLVWCGGSLWLLVRSFQRQKESQAAHDNAARAALQEELARAQRAARTVIDALPHAVAFVSPEGRVEIANGAAARFGLQTGKSLGDIENEWLRGLVDKVRTSRQPQAAGDGKKASDAPVADPPGRTPYLQRFENGRELFYLPQARPVVNDSGQLIGIMVLLVDATGERQLEESRTGLLSTMSHQFKTPMTSIQMAIHLLLEDAADRLTPRQMELLEAARDDSSRLHKLIEELLMSARTAVQSGPLPPAPPLI